MTWKIHKYLIFKLGSSQNKRFQKGLAEQELFSKQEPPIQNQRIGTYDNIVISKLVETKTNLKNLIGYLHKVIRPIVLILPKMRGYIKTFKVKAIYNWKFIHCHLPHLDFCQQYCHIFLRYNTRIRNFWYLISYTVCFSFCLLFYLD